MRLRRLELAAAAVKPADKSDVGLLLRRVQFDHAENHAGCMERLAVLAWVVTRQYQTEQPEGSAEANKIAADLERYESRLWWIRFTAPLRLSRCMEELVALGVLVDGDCEPLRDWERQAFPAPVKPGTRYGW